MPTNVQVIGGRRMSTITEDEAIALRRRLRDEGYARTTGSGRGRFWTRHESRSKVIIVTRHDGQFREDRKTIFTVNEPI